jgi:hypothetical protein
MTNAVAFKRGTIFRDRSRMLHLLEMEGTFVGCGGGRVDLGLILSLRFLA